MKILFILALLLLTLSFSSAQQTHQPPAAMTFSQNYLLLRNQSPKFLYSWNWSNGPSFYYYSAPTELDMGLYEPIGMT